MFLIVIEAESDLGHPGPDPNAYHYQPYRLAATLDEAKELMRDYMGRDNSDGLYLVPKYFAVHKEMDGEFGYPHFFDPSTLNEADPTEWLADTGRC